MKAKKTYVKGKSVFTVSLFVIGITALTVYLSGVNYNRTLNTNFYLSLSIIGICLFLFMSYGLYMGVGLIDNFPKLGDFKVRELFTRWNDLPDFSGFEIGGDDFFTGIIFSIIAWIAMTVLIFIMLVVFDIVFWFSLFIILAMLYWVFFRALKLVFSISPKTKRKLYLSLLYSLGYTLLYVGWMYGIVYAREIWMNS